MHETGMHETQGYGLSLGFGIPLFARAIAFKPRIQSLHRRVLPLKLPEQVWRSRRDTNPHPTIIDPLAIALASSGEC